MKEEIKNLISDAISNVFDVVLDLSEINIEIPKDKKYGDFSSNIAMQLAGKLKMPPIDIANKIIDNIGRSDHIKKVELAGSGFINFFISDEFYIKNLFEVLELKEDYGVINLGNHQKVIVEYSSPNIAKPFTIGHFRSTIIGDAVANILEFTGFTVFRDNHLGDWGTQFGKLIYAIKTWGDEEKIEKSRKPVSELVKLYVKFHKEAEKDTDIEDQGRIWSKKLEDGDKEARRLWKKCIDWSFKEFDKIYSLLNVKFTENNGRGFGESFFEDKIDDVIKDLKSAELLKKSKGAYIVEFDKKDNLPPIIIIRKDGATLYATRELATDKFRLQNYGKDIIIINEVGSEQKLYFRQIFKIEELLGWFKPSQRVHKMHGLYRLKEGKMSTRKGRVIWLEDVLNEAIKRAKKIMENSGKIYSDKELEKISQVVGIGALKWNDLKRQSHLDIVFDWDEILNLDGNSAPYIQYTYARASSILRKSNSSKFYNLKNLKLNNISDQEMKILKLINRFSDVVAKSAIDYAPNYIANYLFELAQEFNRFYKLYPVLAESDVSLKNFRLLLTQSVSLVIKNGLNLLGIEVVDKM